MRRTHPLLRNRQDNAKLACWLCTEILRELKNSRSDYTLSCYILSRNYTLSRKKEIIRRGIGSTWGCNFYTGTHLGRYFLHGHAEWVKTRNLMAGNFDSHLRIKVMAL